MGKSFRKDIESRGLGALIPTGPTESKELPKIRAAAAAMRKAEKIGKVGRPKRSDKDNEAAPSAERGTKPGEARKTYLVNKQLAEKIEDIAYWDRKTTKDVIGDAMAAYVSSWEKKNGSVKSRPNKR